jgi:hypothetical protein
MQAGDLARTHQSWNVVGRNGQSFCDEISADLNKAAGKADLSHGRGA